MNKDKLGARITEETDDTEWLTPTGQKSDPNHAPADSSEDGNNTSIVSTGVPDVSDNDGVRPAG